MIRAAGLLLFGVLSIGSIFYFYKPAPVSAPQQNSQTNSAKLTVVKNGGPGESSAAKPKIVGRDDSPGPSAVGTQGLPGSVSASTGSATTTSGKPTTPTSVAGTNAYTTYGHIYTQAELLAIAGPVDLTSLPLGDNKYTTSSAKKGYVYVCHVATGGQGAQGNGPWIHGTTWDSTTKVAVAGSIPWPNASVKITVSGSTRTIVSNDLPTNHSTGIFPISASDPAAQYDRNQSSITVQNNSLSLPANPNALATPDCIFGVVGVMTNGVSLNDAFDALYRDAAAHEVQDSCDGHPNNEEGYHYHNLSACYKSPTVDQVIGYANDGFPITGPLVTKGNYLTTSDLDECHGLTSTVTMGGKQVTTYHYVMTYDFPYSVSCYRGKSYEPRPSGGAPMGQGQPPPRM
jgi:hypothetical protein